MTVVLSLVLSSIFLDHTPVSSCRSFFAHSSCRSFVSVCCCRSFFAPSFTRSYRSLSSIFLGHTSVSFYRSFFYLPWPHFCFFLPFFLRSFLLSSPFVSAFLPPLLILHFFVCPIVWLGFLLGLFVQRQSSRWRSGLLLFFFVIFLLFVWLTQVRSMCHV